MGRPTQEVDVFTIQDRRGGKRSKPWTVRWRIDGRDRSRSFRTRVEADRYRSHLVRAVTDGESFDLASGEPTSWNRVVEDLTLHQWAKRWVAEQWPEWQPRTRRSAMEALTRFIPLVVRTGTPKPPATLRTYLAGWLDPDQVAEPTHEGARWLERNGLRLSELDKQLLAEVDLGHGFGRDNHRPLGSCTFVAITAWVCSCGSTVREVCCRNTAAVTPRVSTCRTPSVPRRVTAPCSWNQPSAVSTAGLGNQV
jgi:hypothetical protein